MARSLEALGRRVYTTPGMHLAVREAARVTRMSVATFRMYQMIRLLAVRHGVTHNSGVSCRAVRLRLGFRLRPHRAHLYRLR